MKKALIAGGLALSLAACGGGGGKSALVKSCLEDGETPEQCNCMADAAEEELDKDTFAKLVKMAEAGEENAGDIMAEFSPEEQGKFMAFAMKAAMTCGAG